MFKRTFWFGVGSVVGLGSSVYVQRRVKQVAAKVPDRVQRQVTRTAKRVGGDLRGAVTEGRQAMADREEELQAQVDRRTARRPDPS